MSHPTYTHKISPLFDVAFQMLFGEDGPSPRLIGLLNGLLKLPPGLRIVELTVLPPRIQGEIAGEKKVVLDIRATTVMGHRFNLDLQLAPFSLYEVRALYYWSGLYHGQLPSGGRYRDLRPTIGVHILGFCLTSSREEPRYHQVYELRERMSHRLLTEHLELHTIELPKFKLGLDELADEEQKWVYWLKHGDQMSAEQVQSLGLPEIMSAEEKLKMLSQDQILQMQQEQWEKAQRDQTAMRLDWIDYGRQEGMKGMRDAIQAICELLGIEITDKRRAHLGALDLEGLQALLQRLRQERAWP